MMPQDGLDTGRRTSPAAVRAAYRATLVVDEVIWQRAGVYAPHQALLIIPYRRRSNPGLAELAARTIAELLAEGNS